MLPDLRWGFQAVSETLDAHSRQAVKRVSQQCTAGRMQKTFRSLDTSGAGVLSKRQFKHALDLMGLHEDRDDYTTIWRLADARGTGRVNYVSRRVVWCTACAVADAATFGLRR